MATGAQDESAFNDDSDDSDDSDEQAFECMYKCGFEGDYGACEKHEAICRKAPKADFDDSDSD